MKGRSILIVIVFLAFGLKAMGQNKPKSKEGKGYLTISVYYNDATPKDTLEIKLDSYISVFEDLPDKYRYATVNHNHIFRFKVPVKRDCGYFEIRKMFSADNKNPIGALNSAQLVKELFWEKGDNVTIRMVRKRQPTPGSYFYLYDDYNFRFSGKGSTKYFAKLKADSVYLSIAMQPIEPVTATSPAWYAMRTLERKPREIVAAMNVLNNYKSQMTVSAFNVLKADFLFGGPKGSPSQKFEEIGSYYVNNVMNTSVDTQKVFISKFIDEEKDYQLLSKIPDNHLAYSKEFAAYSCYKSAWFYLMNRNKYLINHDKMDDVFNVNRDSVYYKIKNSYEGLIRDKLISYYLIDNKPEHMKNILEDALATIKSPYYYSKIEGYNNKWVEGTKGYNFSLPDTNGKYHSLEEFRGKVVLMDFWFTGCGSCSELNKKVVAPVEDYFKGDTNIVFLSVSLDTRKQIWKSSIASGNYTGSNCIKLYTDGKGYGHPIVGEYAISSFPAVILMDKSGKIARFNTMDIKEKNSLIKVINNFQRSNDNKSIVN